MARFQGWRFELLAKMGAPATKENLRFLDAWQRAEGGGASFNPLNTTQDAPGASKYNSVGVRNYGSPGQGIAATAETLRNGRYGAIVRLLQGGASAEQLGQAVESSPWGTGGGVLRALGAPGGGGGAAPAAAAAPAAPAAPDTSRADFTQALIGAVGKHDNMGAIKALTDLRRTRASSAFSGSPAPADSGGAAPSTPGGTAAPGISELIMDQVGSIFDGTFKPGAYGGHADHVHFATQNAQQMLSAIKLAESLGLRVSENPYVGGVAPVHAKHSYHYRTFPGKYNGRQLGEAIDVGGSLAARREFFRRLSGR